jgi:hypothetical protein
MDITRRSRDMWIIDFELGTPLHNAASYEAPFNFLHENVRNQRQASRSLIKDWWIHERPRVDMRAALAQHCRFVATPTVSKHRLFVWMSAPTLPDHQLIVVARSDDYFFGVLHSRPHEVWALKLGTRLETRPRYTPTTCFETFPFPEPTDAQREAIAAAAKELDTLRNNWLNPLEWTRTEILEFPGSTTGPWRRYLDLSPSHLRGGARGGGDPGNTSTIATVRYPRLVPKDDDCAKHLKKRTLTNLYNQRPTWLDLAHQKLDNAVFAAYGWGPAMSDDDLLAALLALNLQRAAAQPTP